MARMWNARPSEAKVFAEGLEMDLDGITEPSTPSAPVAPEAVPGDVLGSLVTIDRIVVADLFGRDLRERLPGRVAHHAGERNFRGKWRSSRKKSATLMLESIRGGTPWAGASR